MLNVGDVLDGRYEIVAHLAEGGMGAVFRARRILLGDEVAIKVVRSDWGDAPAARERFLRESRACARLRHPHIVSMLDFNIDPAGHPYLVMELLNARSLRQEMTETGPMPLERVRRILPPLCSALEEAHAAGILHRDLKPANIVAHRFESGEVVHKIIDFGLVFALTSADKDETRLTDRQFVGTIGYAAPEQLSGGDVDARADIYSLGVIAFEMFAGRLPFVAPTPMAMVSAQLSAERPRLAPFRPDLPAWVELAIQRAIARDPADRWSRAEEFGNAFLVHAPAAGSAPGGGQGLLAKYDVGETLGHGRLGSEIFKGTHRAMGYPVAIRTLRRTAGRSWEALRARFLREARTLQVSHPSLIQVRDYGEEGDLLYVVTDFVEGPNLRTVLQEGPLPWPRLRPLVSQLASAVAALHRRRGWICGVSPEIIRVTRDDEGERLLVSSGGICQAQDLLATLSDQTLRGAAVADPELKYVPPELLTGASADARSDVYTVGVLAYEMTTGELPFDGGSMPELLGAQLRGTPRDPRDRQPELPATAASALLRCLRPSPDDRWQAVRDFLAEWNR